MSTRFYPRQTDYIVLLNAMDDDVQLAIQKGDLAVQWAIKPSGEVVPGMGYSALYYATQAGQYAAQVNNGIAQSQAWATQPTGEVVAGKGYSAYYYSQQASGSAVLALNWATSMTTFTGSGGMYGAKYYATDAASSAASALDSRDKAKGSSDLAQLWATKAAGEVVAGQGYSALKYASNAGVSATQASDSAALASNWATAMAPFTGSGGLYGAKYYATGAASSATASMKWATQLGDEVVAGQGYSAAQYAANASGSATLAQKWASLLGETVDGTDYSAKKHAIDAKAYMEAAQAAANGATQGQINSDWNEADPTAKAFIRNKPHIPENGADIGLEKVENKSAQDILGELEGEQVLTALGDSVVKTDDTDQIIEGIKSFTQAIKVPTISQDVAPGSDAASTQYVVDTVAKSGADVSRQLKRAMALAILGL